MPKDDKSQPTVNDQQSPVGTPPSSVSNDDVMPPMIHDNLNGSSVAPIGDVKQSDVVMPMVTSSTTVTPKKKFAGGKVIATILGLVVLVGGLGAGIFLVQQQQLSEKAYTNITTPPTDSCSFIQVSTASESVNCPRISGSQTNNISSHSVTYSLKNITTSVHQVAITKKSHFCTEPLGQADPALPNWPVCYSSAVTSTETISINPNETKTVTIQRSSDRGMACGSYQTDLYITSVDNNVNCHGRDNNGLIAASLCQTGITCSGDVTGSAYCQQIKAYSGANWVLLNAESISRIRPGDIVNFCATGVASSGAFDKARFKINGTQRSETTTKRPNSQDFCDAYTVGQEKTFSVTAELHHTTLGWK